MGEETNRKYCVRIKNGDYGRMWYSGKAGEVFTVRISDNPNAGYSVVSDDANRVRTIDKDHAELFGPVGDFTVGKRMDEETVARALTLAEGANAGHESVTTTQKHITALARTVAELRRELDAVKTNVQTIAETATSADYKAGQALASASQFADRLDALGELYDTHADSIEMLTDDIVLLDERTQPLTSEGISELSTELAKVVERTIRTEGIRRGR